MPGFFSRSKLVGVAAASLTTAQVLQAQQNGTINPYRINLPFGSGLIVGNVVTCLMQNKLGHNSVVEVVLFANSLLAFAAESFLGVNGRNALINLNLATAIISAGIASQMENDRIENQPVFNNRPR